MAEKVKIESYKENSDYIEQKDDELIYNLEFMISNEQRQRALDICNLMGERIFSRPDLALQKISALKKLGYFSVAHDFIRECKQKESAWTSSWKESENLERKAVYAEYMLNLAWERPISSGRYEQLQKTEEYIKKNFDSNSKIYGHYYFMYGWLELGDKLYEKVIQTITKAKDVFLSYHKTEQNLDIADCYRYLGQAYYHLSNGDKSEECYEKERVIREQLQGTKSAEYGIVLNSLANVRGCLKNDYQYGLAYIQQSLDIYEQTIGEANQNYMIALDWHGWYLFKLKRFDESVIIWEKAIRLAYQVFGGDYYIYKNLRDYNLWSLYNEFDILERIQYGFLEPAQDNLIAGNNKLAHDQCYVGIDLLERLKANNTKNYSMDKILKLIESLKKIMQDSKI